MDQDYDRPTIAAEWADALDKATNTEDDSYGVLTPATLLSIAHTDGRIAGVEIAGTDAHNEHGLGDDTMVSADFCWTVRYDETHGWWVGQDYDRPTIAVGLDVETDLAAAGIGPHTDPQVRRACAATDPTDTQVALLDVAEEEQAALVIRYRAALQVEIARLAETRGFDVSTNLEGRWTRTPTDDGSDEDAETVEQQVWQTAHDRLRVSAAMGWTILTPVPDVEARIEPRPLEGFPGRHHLQLLVSDPGLRWSDWDGHSVLDQADLFDSGVLEAYENRCAALLVERCARLGEIGVIVTWHRRRTSSVAAAISRADRRGDHDTAAALRRTGWSSVATVEAAHR